MPKSSDVATARIPPKATMIGFPLGSSPRAVAIPARAGGVPETETAEGTEGVALAPGAGVAPI